MRRLLVPVLLALSACATRPEPVAVVAAPPPPVELAPPPLPAGATPGMAIPTRLADGAWVTPAHGLTQAGAAWNLRAALNVAALACRGPEGEALVAGYNRFLGDRRAVLKDAEARYAAEWRAGGVDWQGRYDGQMTRAYNFYGQSFARAGFCAAAGQVLTEIAAAPEADYAAAAPRHLRTLEAPFTTFFAAYDAWHTGQVPVQVAAAAPVTTPVLALAAAVPVAPPRAEPRLEVDPAIFRLP